jgi:diazepam-binding inhibitor (GABA receptor modulating acyl-CoA-binding protein)
VANSKTLPERPGNATLLKLYALYKQASEGDRQASGLTDMVGRAKFDAWAALKGTTGEEAMQRYRLVEQLRACHFRAVSGEVLVEEAVDLAFDRRA